MNIHFKQATLADKDLIFGWLDKPHVQEFWDNSPGHRTDILNFMNGREEPSTYANGIFTYWVGSLENEPYCLLMTSEASVEDDLPEDWFSHLSKTGKTYTIDFMIGSKQHLGKGLAAPTLSAFTSYLNREIDTRIDTFIIDPAETNPRAKHVYEKAGFKTVVEFLREEGYFKGIKHFLMVKTFNS